MIRTVIKILKKHLDYAEVSYDEMWEALELTPFDVLREFPDYHGLRRLARELIVTIKGEDTSKLVKVPSQAAAKKFLKSISTDRERENKNYDWLLSYNARSLRIWLAGYRQQSKVRVPHIIIDT